MSKHLGEWRAGRHNMNVHAHAHAHMQTCFCACCGAVVPGMAPNPCPSGLERGLNKWWEGGKEREISTAHRDVNDYTGGKGRTAPPFNVAVSSIE